MSVLQVAFHFNNSDDLVFAINTDISADELIRKTSESKRLLFTKEVTTDRKNYSIDMEYVQYFEIHETDAPKLSDVCSKVLQKMSRIVKTPDKYGSYGKKFWSEGYNQCQRDVNKILREISQEEYDS